ncbi:hypothetical protein [Actinoplanes sp. NPDC049265]|uniref:hypothetical protein n=1 Tax=Actinoplanes sp. NPDC049265 TaxID=3363902 RepID=UPI0037152B2E
MTQPELLLHNKGNPASAVDLGPAPKYSWFAPALLGRMLYDGTLGQATYGKDTSGDRAMLSRRGLITMLGDWAPAVL